LRINKFYHLSVHQYVFIRYHFIYGYIQKFSAFASVLILLKFRHERDVMSAHPLAYVISYPEYQTELHRMRRLATHLLL
jgi:hypothetical protein